SYSENVIYIQEKLSRLQTSILNYFRLSFLVVPIWLTFLIIGFKLFFNINIYNFGDTWWWISQLIFSAISLPLAVWMFIQVSYKNINKRWVRFFIKNAGGEQATKAMEFLKEINEFKKD
ncbi:MAG: hypothetical protein ABI462_11865, partial [Ignavibacteria bacterium]